MSENFEQQVKSILDDVQIEPRTAVWQNVKGAIEPGKRKRRFIFWWLLPVALTAGGLVYFFNTNNNSQVVENRNDIASTKTISEKQQTADNNSKPGITIIKEPVYATEKINLSEANQLPVSLSRQKFTAETKQKKNNYSDPSSQTFNAEKNTKSLLNSQITGEADQKTGITLENNNNKVIVIDTGSHKNTAVSQDNADQKQPPVTSDSTQTPTSPAIEQLSSKKSKWSFGISAELGVTTTTGGIFNGTNKATMDVLSSGPTGPASGFTTITYQNTTASARRSFGVYITAHRDISKFVSFQSSVGFRHQSFSVTVSQSKDSFVTGSMVTYPIVRNSTLHKLNYLNIYNGFSLKLVKLNELKLGIGAGIDNQFLLGAKQTRTHESLFNNLSFIQEKNTSVSGYNTWQPLLRVHLTADFNSQKKKWMQLSPYFNYGLRSFEKYPSSSKDHVSSFGLTATYFFK